MRKIEFHGNYLATRSLIPCIRIDLEKGISNVAEGIILAKIYREFMKLSKPFYNIKDKSIEYIGVNDGSFKKLENINENRN